MLSAASLTGVKADVERSCLILETGVNQRWRYGGWRPSPDSIAEAEGWEEAKQGLEGLHFLAVQPDPDRWGQFVIVAVVTVGFLFALHWCM
jgi:hypothetical protein